VLEKGPVSKVLIVDDDQESRSLLSEFLEGNGYAVTAVEDGSTAREILSREKDCRIVIADLRMPKESGLQMLRNLHRQNCKSDVILMSSFVSRQEKQKALELGVHALLEKPLRFTELLEIVSKLAEKHSIEISS
jgi:DNA-binding response OmpR family regulator